jgi:hypothetical protein
MTPETVLITGASSGIGKDAQQDRNLLLGQQTWRRPSSPNRGGLL